MLHHYLLCLSQLCNSLVCNSLVCNSRGLNQGSELVSTLHPPKNALDSMTDSKRASLWSQCHGDRSYWY